MARFDTIFLTKAVILSSLLFYFYIYCTDAATTATNKRQRNSQSYRLPDTVFPTKYRLNILTNLDENKFDFEGTVLIEVSEGVVLRIRIRCGKKKKKKGLNLSALHLALTDTMRKKYQ